MSCVRRLSVCSLLRLILSHFLVGPRCSHRRKKSSIRPGSPTAQAVYMVTRVRKGGLPTAVIHPCPHWPVNVRAGAVIYVPNSPTTQATYNPIGL